MAFDDTGKTLAPPPVDDRPSLLDVLGIDPSYEKRMDAVLERNHALREKAWTTPLSAAEQQELDCLELELEELEAIILAEVREKSPRENGIMVMPSTGEKYLLTPEMVYNI
jgi:hypothetical protein